MLYPLCNIFAEPSVYLRKRKHRIQFDYILNNMAPKMPSELRPRAAAAMEHMLKRPAGRGSSAAASDDHNASFDVASIAGSQRSSRGNDTALEAVRQLLSVQSWAETKTHLENCKYKKARISQLKARMLEERILVQAEDGEVQTMAEWSNAAVAGACSMVYTLAVAGLVVAAVAAADAAAVAFAAAAIVWSKLLMLLFCNSLADAVALRLPLQTYISNVMKH